MRTVSIHEAKKYLSWLADDVARGEPFVITKAGKPLVKVVPIEQAASARTRRIGFMAGQFSVSDDFDRMGCEQIERLFGSGI